MNSRFETLHSVVLISVAQLIFILSPFARKFISGGCSVLREFWLFKFFKLIRLRSWNAGMRCDSFRVRFCKLVVVVCTFLKENSSSGWRNFYVVELLSKNDAVLLMWILTGSQWLAYSCFKRVLGFIPVFSRPALFLMPSQRVFFACFKFLLANEVLPSGVIYSYLPWLADFRIPLGFLGHRAEWA